jgi:alcohol dehydrogenase (cytochrome c)
MVSSNRMSRLALALIGLALLALALAILTYAVKPLRWRAIVLYEMANGTLPDLKWSDTRWLMSRGNGVDLERLAKTHNPYESIETPRRSKSDVEAGAALFRQVCSPCHGEGGQGGLGGPSLENHVFRQGRSDWALYRTVKYGVPGTAMPANNFPRDQAWQLISYLREILAGGAGGASLANGLAPLKIEPVTAEQLRGAEDDSAEWLTYSGSYSGHRHSGLAQINRGNVGELKVEWQRQLETPVQKVETTPLVRGSTMFVTEPPNRVLALDAVSGSVLWTYEHDLPSKILACCGPVNRGVALLGNRLFVGTLDAHLIALQAETGQVLWDVEVAKPSAGYSITAAPLAINDMVVTGVAGGEYGIRGFIDAYDAATGKRRWRFYTVPDPGQPGSETWGSASLAKGGAPTWLTGAFDPELHLIYWGVGNPSPNFYGNNRQGDNLYSNSVVALDADSGQLKWYFQFTPHDLHDWDSVQIPVLVNAPAKDSQSKLLSWANRNGFYYLLDRTNGKFLLANPFVKQTWADGLDQKGRPKVRPESVPSAQGSQVYPGIAGATNWWSPAYSPELGLMYVPTVDKGAIFYGSAREPLDEFGEDLGGTTMAIPNEDATVGVKAIDVLTGEIRWQHLDKPRRTYMEMNGLLGTAGKLVFAGDAENFLAMDAETGKELWHFPAGTEIWAAPISYEVGGRQYIAIAAGRTILAFALPSKVAH